MAKSIIVNKINQKNHHISVPCDGTNAGTFAALVLDGEYEVYEYDTELGTETETSYNDVQLMVKNSTSKEKSYLNLKCKANKTEQDIFGVVIGLTINDTVVDEAFIISQRLVTL